jgi:hypothetical protein
MLDNIKPIPKCSIKPDDSIYFGSGGSNTIIVITKDKRAYKFFPFYYNKLSSDYKKAIEAEKKKTINEINIGKSISRNIVDKGITPHYVKFYGYNICTNIKKVFGTCPNFINFMLEKEKSKLCVELYKKHPIKSLDKEYFVLSMEYCNSSCAEFIENISKLGTNKIKYFLDIFFFQIFYTLLKTKEVYPWFFHRDLFMRNILGTKTTKSNRYYRYHYKSLIFDVPVEIFIPKITDFGNSNLNEKFHNVKLIKSHSVDFYNITWDIYDGACLGSKSFTKIFESNPTKLLFIKKYFNTYFNVKRIDGLKKLNPSYMNNGWYSIFDKKFSSYINYKEPVYLFKKYFSKIFPYDSSHEIERVFM